jgi:hypothetical protein
MKRREMINEVCLYFGVKPDDIQSLRRDKYTASAKKVIYCVLRMFRLTFNQIGRIVNKDHQTVLITIRRTDKKLKKYAEYIYKKYMKLGLEEEINQQQFILRNQRRKIIELLNKGYLKSQISKETHLDPDFIEEQIRFFLENHWQKKIPNYKNGTYLIIFYEKDLVKSTI